MLDQNAAMIRALRFVLPNTVITLNKLTSKLEPVAVYFGIMQQILETSFGKRNVQWTSSTKENRGSQTVLKSTICF